MMIYFVDHIVDPFWITQTFAPFRHSFQNIFVLVRTYSPKRIYVISSIGIDTVIEKWLQTMSDLKYEPEFSYSIIQGEAVFNIFETADNNLMMRIDHSILPQGQPLGQMTSLLHGGHVRLGVNFMSWSNCCVLVWLSLSWWDYITLSDTIRICGHATDDVITLWWSRESWYDFPPSWLKCLSWCDFVCLGVILYLGAINWILVWFSSSWLKFSS